MPGIQEEKSFSDDDNDYAQEIVKSAEREIVDILRDDLIITVQTSQSTIQLNKPICSANLSPKDIFYRGKQVKELIMLGYFDNQKSHTKIYDYSATRVILEYTDNTHVVLQFKTSGNVIQLRLYQQLKEANGNIEEANIFYGKGSEKLKWMGINLSYTDEEKEIYTRIHSEIANSLVKSIKKNSEYLTQAKVGGICILGLGTGDGKDVQACYDKLCQSGIITDDNKEKCKVVGFDSNEEIIEANKQTSPHSFFTAKSEKIGEEIKKLIDSHQLKIENQLVVVIACGSLTRQVLDGTYPALQVLQQLAAYNKVNLIIASGHTHVMLTKESAEAAGYELQSTSFEVSEDYLNMNSRRQIFTLTPSPNYVLAGEVSDRSLARTKVHKGLFVLDLSLTSKPTVLCRFYAEHVSFADKVKLIDLSWSHLSQEDVLTLLTLFKQFKYLKYVMISNFETQWSQHLIDEVKKNVSSTSFTLLQRTDSSYPDELPTISPSVAKKVGAYTDLPNIVIIKGERALDQTSANPSRFKFNPNARVFVPSDTPHDAPSVKVKLER